MNLRKEEEGEVWRERERREEEGEGKEGREKRKSWGKRGLEPS